MTDHTSCCVDDGLESVQELCRKADQQRITHIKLCQHETGDERHNSMTRQRPLDAPQLTQDAETACSSSGDVCRHGRISVQINAEVSNGGDRCNIGTDTILSNTVLWQSWIVAYPRYTLQMKMLFLRWPIMLHDTRKRKKKESTSIYVVARWSSIFSVLSAYFCCASVYCMFVDKCRSVHNGDEGRSGAAVSRSWCRRKQLSNTEWAVYCNAQTRLHRRWFSY